MNETTTTQEDNTNVLQTINEQHTLSGRLGGEVHLHHSIKVGEDQYGQERIVFRQKKDIDCGHKMATEVEEHVFETEEALVAWLSEQWYEDIIAERLADEIGERFGFEAEDIMYPYQMMKNRLQEMEDIDRKQAHKMAAEWMKEEHPEHYGDEEDDEQ